MAKLEAPSLLAFEHKLNCSDAVFSQTDGSSPEAQEQSVTVSEKSVRDIISNHLRNVIANDPARLGAEIGKANL